MPRKKKTAKTRVHPITKLQQENAGLLARIDGFKLVNTRMHNDNTRLREELDRQVKHWNANFDKHPHMIEEQLKTWSFTLNKLGIGLSLGSNWVSFTKGTMRIELYIDHVLMHGLDLIIRMMDLVPGHPAAFNRVDGKHGWKHPEAIAADKDVAMEQAGKLLRTAGFAEGEEVAVKVAKDD
jgi:hypothetical protein